MWTYYGTKKKIAKHYPTPLYDKIIEPFAGAEQYSLYGDKWKKDVLVVDKYDVITDLWKYLINATPQDIMSLPDMNEGENVDTHTQLCKEEKYLIGFCINSGSAQPKKTVKKFNCWNRSKISIAENLYKIKHWKVQLGTYADIPNEVATWYIDPPYSGLHGGIYYRHSSKKIDYEHLGIWSKERHGQVIICGNIDETWVGFKPLVELKGQLHKRMEGIYYQIDGQQVILNQMFPV